MSPTARKAAHDPVIGGMVKSFIKIPQSGSEVASMIVEARANKRHHEALEIASAFDLQRKEGE